jgi:hypothetical protein
LIFGVKVALNTKNQIKSNRSGKKKKYKKLLIENLNSDIVGLNFKRIHNILVCCHLLETYHQWCGLEFRSGKKKNTRKS